MANHVKFEEATTVLPGNPEDGELLEDGTVVYPDGTRVAPLHVMQTERERISCWELTPEEIAHVIHTGRVYLFVYGGLHPPVFVSGMPIGKTADEAAAAIAEKILFPAEPNAHMVGPDTPVED